MTQEQLAKKLNMSESNLSHMLSRGTTDPDIMKIIAQFLKFDVSLFNRDSQIKSPGAQMQPVEKDYQNQVEYLKEIIKAKDDLIRAKDELIANLKRN